VNFFGNRGQKAIAFGRAGMEKSVALVSITSASK
jgi:hypothetical protein